MNNSISFNYAVSTKSNHLSFKNIPKKTIKQVVSKTTNPTHADTVTALTVTSALALGQFAKQNTTNPQIGSNLAKVPESVEEMKARLTFNVPTKSSELNSQIKSIEDAMELIKQDIASTKYVEYTGANTPESNFTVYEPGEDGKYHITQQSKDPDRMIANWNGKFDLYYNADGNEIGTTRYDSETNARKSTEIMYNGKTMAKMYNPDGTIKFYQIDTVNSENVRAIRYDANGQVESIDIAKLFVENQTKPIYGLAIGRTPERRAFSKWTTDENGTTVEFEKNNYVYRGKVDPEVGLVNVVKIGEAAQSKT